MLNKSKIITRKVLIEEKSCAVGMWMQKLNFPLVLAAEELFRVKSFLSSPDQDQ